MQLVLMLVAALVFACIALGVWYFSADQRMLRRMKSAPLMRVGDVSEGQKVRIVGQAELIAPIAAPLSGRACACWRVVVRERIQRGKSSYWKTVVDEQETSHFVLIDGTSKALVKAADASVVLDKDWKASSGLFNDATPELEAFLGERGYTSQGFVFNKNMKFSEGVLEAGEMVSVVGVGSWERDPDEAAQAGGYREATPPRRLVMTSPAEELLLLSDEPVMLK